MFQTKVVEKVKTHILCSITFPPLENRAVYEITWTNIVGHANICWILKAVNTYSDCNNGCTNAPKCYVLRQLPVLLMLPYSYINVFAVFALL
jgi:hypothetical protein